MNFDPLPMNLFFHVKPARHPTALVNFHAMEIFRKKFPCDVNFSG